MLGKSKLFILKHSIKEFFFGKHKASFKEVQFTAFHECLVDYAYRLKAQVKIMNEMHENIKMQVKTDQKFTAPSVKNVTEFIDRIFHELSEELDHKTKEIVILDKKIKKCSVDKEAIADVLKKVNNTIEKSTITLRSLNKISVKIKNGEALPHLSEICSDMSMFKPIREVSPGQENRLMGYADRLMEQFDQAQKAHRNFMAIITTKMNPAELTYSRFKTTADNIVLAITDKADQMIALIETLKVMEDTHFSNPEISGQHFKALDEGVEANAKTITALFDISLKIAQMKNKDSHVEFADAWDELDYLSKNIKQYIEK